MPMKRSSLLVCLAVSALAACSYYDTGLLKFSPDDPEPTAGSAGASGATAAGNAGVAGTTAGTAGSSGTGGTAGAASGAAGAAGEGGAAGTSGGSGAGAGQGGAAGDPTGGSGGAAGTQPLVCSRATVPTRPVLNVGGAAGAAGTAGSAGANAGGAGANAGGAAGASGQAGAGATGPGFSTPDNLIFAIRSMDFGENIDPAKSEIGFDLDGSCTCYDAPGEICKPWQPRDPLCDGPGGRDNSFPRLLKQLVSYSFADDSAAISKKFNDGGYSILIRVQGWNLLPDDPDVTVSFYTSDGTLSTPEWNTKDSWTVLDSCVNDGDIDKPKLRDTSAYVSGGQLVAALPSFDVNDDKVFIQLNDSFGLALTGTVIVVKLNQLLDHYALTEGTLSGRWRDKDFFSQVGLVKNASFGSICKDNFLYPEIKSAFCKFADLPGNVSDATGVCSAMSMAIGFAAQEARLGAVVPASVPPASQCPAATDPKTDNCSVP
jgi:hypothetical protein